MTRTGPREAPLGPRLRPRHAPLHCTAGPRSRLASRGLLPYAVHPCPRALQGRERAGRLYLEGWAAEKALPSGRATCCIPQPAAPHLEGPGEGRADRLSLSEENEGLACDRPPRARVAAASAPSQAELTDGGRCVLGGASRTSPFLARGVRSSKRAQTPACAPHGARRGALSHWQASCQPQAHRRPPGAVRASARADLNHLGDVSSTCRRRPRLSSAPGEGGGQSLCKREARVDASRVRDFLALSSNYSQWLEAGGWRRRRATGERAEASSGRGPPSETAPRRGAFYFTR